MHLFVRDREFLRYCSEKDGPGLDILVSYFKGVSGRGYEGGDLSGMNMEPFSVFAGMCVLFSFFVAAALYLPGIRFGINLADEGYLWLGARSVLNAEVPIRDFRAYDPGRYYWCALWMRFLGRDLFSMRLCLLATQALGLSAAAAAVLVAGGGCVPAGAVVIFLGVVMSQFHRQIDMAVSLAVVFFAVLLTANPSPPVYVLSGIAVGLSLWMGLNHWLYAFLGFVLLMVLMAVRGAGLPASEALLCFGAGLGAGLAVLLAVYALTPGFLKAYVKRKIVKMLRRRSTNLALPVPWLWKRDILENLRRFRRPERLFVSFMFTLIPLLYGYVFWTVLRSDAPLSDIGWGTVAAASAGVFYYHHALSRADTEHLVLAMAPFLVTIVLLASEQAPFRLLVAAVAGLSVVYIYAGQDGTALSRFFRKEEFRPVVIGGERLWLRAYEADLLGRLYAWTEKHSRAGEPVLMLPLLVTLYPLFDRAPAIYDTFCVYPADEGEEAGMIRELERAEAPLAVIINVALDGRDDLKFCHTHPRLWHYLQEHYVCRSDVEDLCADMTLFVREKNDA